MYCVEVTSSNKMALEMAITVTKFRFPMMFCMRAPCFFTAYHWVMFSTTAAGIEKKRNSLAEVDMVLRRWMPSKCSLLNIMEIMVIQTPQKPFQNTSCKGDTVMDLSVRRSCCHTARIERKTALIPANVMAIALIPFTVLASPRTHRTEPTLAMVTEKMVIRWKQGRVPLATSKRKVTKGPMASIMETKAKPPKTKAALLVKSDALFNREMGKTAMASFHWGRSPHAKIVMQTAIIWKPVMHAG